MTTIAHLIKSSILLHLEKVFFVSAIFFALIFSASSDAKERPKTMSFFCSAYEHQDAIFEVKFLGFSDRWDVTIKDKSKIILNNIAVFRGVSQLEKPRTKDDKYLHFLLRGTSSSKREHTGLHLAVIGELINEIPYYGIFSMTFITLKNNKLHDLNCKSESKRFV
jgi:hypothetical protein